MNYPAHIKARPSLADIGAAFDRLRVEEQLYLLDHLADRGGFDLDTHELAVEYAKTQFSHDDKIAEWADRVIPKTFNTPERESFTAGRDRRLEYYLGRGM